MTRSIALPRALGLRDEDDWRTFLETHRRRVRTILRGAVRLYGSFPWIDFDDLEQDVYCRLLAARASCHSIAETSAYLRQVAHSVVLDHRRSCLADKRRLEWASPRFYGRADEISGEMVYRPWATTPDQDLRRREGWRQIRRHGQRICRSGRGGRLELRALRLVLVQGCSSSEVSTRLGGRVKPHEVDRLIGRLRQSLRSEGIRLPRRRQSSTRVDVDPEQRSRRTG